MSELHDCQVDDVCGNTHVLRDRTLPELEGVIGPRWPIVLDGAPGSLGRDERDEVVFLPAR